MTQPPEQPYGPPTHHPYGGPAQPHTPYAAPPPRRQRPRVVWFVLGGGLLVLAPIVFGAALFLTLRPLAQEDAVLAADGSPHRVELPRGEERGLFADDLATSCVVVDGSGAAVDVRPAGGDFTWNEWTAVGRFSTADGDLTFTCTGASAESEVRIGELPSTGGLLGGIAATILLPLLLGLTGLVVLVVTAVRWATGAPRKPRT